MKNCDKGQCCDCKYSNCIGIICKECKLHNEDSISDYVCICLQNDDSEKCPHFESIVDEETEDVER